MQSAPDMNDQERAVDQLVDEVSARAWRLKVLIDDATDGARVTADGRVRHAACSLVSEMSTPGEQAANTAAALVDALWPDAPGRAVDDPWWDTPLGRVVQGARRCRDRAHDCDRAHDASPDGRTPTMLISVDVVDRGDTVLVRIDGELDLAAIPTVRSNVTPHLVRRLTIDLAGVHFLDSSGVRCLCDLHDEAIRAGGALTIGATSPPVRRTLHLAGLPPSMFGI
jgi:anti-sigma B factor antagonist